MKLIRTKEAQRLLADSSLKISAVARRVGLKDPSQFIRDFRLITGSTPGAYRQSAIAKP
jgi:AraC-like DNA-binding protein